LNRWPAAPEPAPAANDRATIKAVLKDAVPEFGPAVGEECSEPPAAL
jgi:hypothetical protein